MSKIRELLSLDDDERRIRNAIIEECARVADNYVLSIHSGYNTARQIAVAIRALKG